MAQLSVAPSVDMDKRLYYSTNQCLFQACLGGISHPKRIFAQTIGDALRHSELFTIQQNVLSVRKSPQSQCEY